MRKNIILLLFVTLFVLSACSSSSTSTNSENQETIESESENNSNENNSIVLESGECLTELPENITSNTIENYQLAQSGDFFAPIREFEQQTDRGKFTCSGYSLDFNQDQLIDYALFLVKPDRSSFKFILLINQGNQNFSTLYTKDYPVVNEPDQGIIYTSMGYKPVGELGILRREYSPIKTDSPEGKIFANSSAIELWDAIKEEGKKVPMDLDLSTLAYCSEVLYWNQEELATVTVCD